MTSQTTVIKGIRNLSPVIYIILYVRPRLLSPNFLYRHISSVIRLKCADIKEYIYASKCGACGPSPIIWGRCAPLLDSNYLPFISQVDQYLFSGASASYSRRLDARWEYFSLCSYFHLSLTQLCTPLNTCIGHFCTLKWCLGAIRLGWFTWEYRSSAAAVLKIMNRDPRLGCSGHYVNAKISPIHDIDSRSSVLSLITVAQVQTLTGRSHIFDA